MDAPLDDLKTKKNKAVKRKKAQKNKEILNRKLHFSCSECITESFISHINWKIFSFTQWMIGLWQK